MLQRNYIFYSDLYQHLQASGTSQCYGLLSILVTLLILCSPNPCVKMFSSSLLIRFLFFCLLWSHVPPRSSAVLYQIEPVSLSKLSEIVTQLPHASCPIVSIPFCLFKEVSDSNESCIFKLVNSCLSSECPNSFQRALVQLLIKKKKLDVLTNFRPISKIPFLCKVLENLVFFSLPALNPLFEEFLMTIF